MDALPLRGLDAKLLTFASKVGCTFDRQSLVEMHRFGFSTAIVTNILKEVCLHSGVCAANINTRRRSTERQKPQLPQQPQ